MLLNGKNPIPPRSILDQIWTEEDSDNAGTKIKSLAYRLQTYFGVISDYRLIVSTPTGYQLNPELNIMTDIQQFEECWTKAQGTIMTQTKLELLKKATELYRGNIYDSASSEHWLMAYEYSYRYKCLGIYNEIMRIYFDLQDYSNVQYYASLALNVDKTSVDAYYWMIRAMKLRDSLALAKGELKTAELILTDEEYAELLEKLNKAQKVAI